MDLRRQSEAQVLRVVQGEGQDDEAGEQRLLRPESSLQSCNLTKMTKGKRYLTKDIGPPSCIPFNNYKDELLSPEDKKLLCLFLLLFVIWRLGSWQESVLTGSQHRLRNGKRSEFF